MDFLSETHHPVRSLTVKMEDFTRNTRLFFSTPKRRASISLTYINIEFNRNSSRDSLHTKHDPSVVRAKDPRSKNPQRKMPKQNNPQGSRRHVLRRTPRSAPESQASPLPPSLGTAPRPALHKPCSLPALSSCFHTTVSGVRRPASSSPSLPLAPSVLST